MHRFKNKNKKVRMGPARNLDEFRESILFQWILNCGERQVAGYGNEDSPKILRGEIFMSNYQNF